MNLRDVVQKIGWTPSERKVIYFLIITLLIGIGIRAYAVVTGSGTLPRFEYGESDRAFAEGSQKLHAFAPEAIAQRENGRAPVKEPGAPVRINTASKPELMRLPGVGPVLADRIIEYRATHGLFHSPEDLLNVSGIGDKKFHKLQQHIIVP